MRVIHCRALLIPVLGIEAVEGEVGHLLHVLEVIKSRTIYYRPSERDVFIIRQYSAPASIDGADKALF